MKMKYSSLAYVPIIILAYCYTQGILVYFKIGYFPSYGITPQPSLSLYHKIESSNGIVFILLLISLLSGIIISSVILLKKKYTLFKNDVCIFFIGFALSLISLIWHNDFWDWLLD